MREMRWYVEVSSMDTGAMFSGLQAGSATYWPCGLGQGPFCLWACFLICKIGILVLVTFHGYSED